METDEEETPSADGAGHPTADGHAGAGDALEDDTHDGV